MPQQIAQPLHDRETETQTAAALARAVVELMILLEDCLQFVRGDADARIPDFDLHGVFAAAATKQQLAVRCVFQRVRQQVADHLREQARIAANLDLARNNVQLQALCLGQKREFVRHAVEQLTDGKSGNFGRHRAGLDLVDVEQPVQHG